MNCICKCLFLLVLMRLGVAELMVWLTLEYELLCFIDDFIRYIVNTYIL